MTTQGDERETVRIGRLGEADAAIRDRVFRDADIWGPAVIVLRGCALESNSFDGPEDAIFWEVPAGKTMTIGAILVERCEFHGCAFHGIGIAGTPGDIAEMKPGFSS